MSYPSQELDPDVIRAATREGSASAFQKLYEHYADRVRYAVARAAQLRRHAKNVDELNQEVWCRLLNNDCLLLQRHDPSRGRFGPFISTVAYQQASKAIDQYERQMPLGESEMGNSALVDEQSLRFVEQIIDAELFGKLLVRINVELEEHERVLIREFHIEQRGSRAVAQQLEISENTLHKRNERLKKKLARILQELLRIPPRPTTGQPPMPVLLALLAIGLALHASSGLRGSIDDGAPQSSQEA